MQTVQLIISALTPVIVAILGWKISRTLKDIEQSQWYSRKLIEKRIEIYDKISPMLNRLFCYFHWVGDWKENSPVDIIKTKRSLDHTVYIYKYLLDPEFFTTYVHFMDALFTTYNSAGEDARLRTMIAGIDGDRSKLSSWEPKFATCFDLTDIAPLSEISKRYERVMQAQRKGILI